MPPVWHTIPVSADHTKHGNSKTLLVLLCRGEGKDYVLRKIKIVM